MNFDIDGKKYEAKSNFNEYNKLLKTKNDSLKLASSRTNSMNTSKEPITVISSTRKAHHKINSLSTKTEGYNLSMTKSIIMHNLSKNNQVNHIEVKPEKAEKPLKHNNLEANFYLKEDESRNSILHLENLSTTKNNFLLKSSKKSSNSYRSSPKASKKLQVFSPEQSFLSGAYVNYGNHNNNIRASSNEKIYIDAGGGTNIQGGIAYVRTSKEASDNKIKRNTSPSNPFKKTNVEVIKEETHTQKIKSSNLKLSNILRLDKEKNSTKTANNQVLLSYTTPRELKIDIVNQDYDKDLRLSYNKSTKDSTLGVKNSNIMPQQMSFECPEELHFFNVQLSKCTTSIYALKFENMTFDGEKK